jgi:hypothetical protein
MRGWRVEASGWSGLAGPLRPALLQLAAATRQLLTVVAAESQVERVLQLTGVDKALPLFGDRAVALATLAKTPSA